LFPKPTPLATASSDIFMLQADWTEQRLIIPPHQLEPLFLIDGFSTLPTTSDDGTRVAFLNRKKIANKTRYNLAIASIDGTIRRYIDAVTMRFSRPAFVGTSVLVNELFENHYRTILFDVANNSTSQISVLEYTPKALELLERVEIQIQE
jgi:hypothetical protein